MTVSKFKVGDRVYSPYHNYGTIVEIDGSDKSYPITVKWDVSRYKIGIDLSTFTEDGYLFLSDKTENTKITKAKFKLMDKVFYPSYGKGTVVGEDRTDVPFPIRVFWDKPLYKNESTSSFTRDGVMSISRFVDSDEVKLILVKDIPKEKTGGLEMGQSAGVSNHNIVERMEDALNKKVEDAVNPAHYKVEGLPEAIDIINHLMHREQYEGFLWGNILKYAYRFGRKGDKAETAGKIEWYAKQLKDLEEEI